MKEFALESRSKALPQLGWELLRTSSDMSKMELYAQVLAKEIQSREYRVREV